MSTNALLNKLFTTSQQATKLANQESKKLYTPQSTTSAGIIKSFKASSGEEDLGSKTVYSTRSP